MKDEIPNYRAVPTPLAPDICCNCDERIYDSGPYHKHDRTDLLWCAKPKSQEKAA